MILTPEVTAEVRSALRCKAPVVALESTIIAHGMPYPQNVETAKEVEDIVRIANERTLVMALIETAEGIANVDAIAAVLLGAIERDIGLTEQFSLTLVGV